MAREALPRLNIPQPVNLAHQQPVSYTDSAQSMFSPSLPSTLQQGFHPPFPVPPFFPQRPHHPSPSLAHPSPHPSPHHYSPSLAQLAAAGIHPPNAFPIPHGHFPRPSLALSPGQPAGPPFPHRNRRQPSIGGPPKAVLGGPARKLNPPPVGAPAGTTASLSPATTQPATSKKKVNINLPKESVSSDDGQITRPTWARAPLDDPVDYDANLKIPPVQITTADIFPPDQWRLGVPVSIDVFLPGKIAWDAMKQQAIEEKLEKLGVEKGSGSNVPHIYAPHARAASISSPADPALLLFKLNKLQQTQDSANNSYSSSSPQPAGLTPSPRVPGAPAPRFLANNNAPARHGYSLSLAQSPGGYNPFGPTATLGSDQPTSLVPSAGSRPDSRPDYMRGFGLDIPEEPEEEERAATDAEADARDRAEHSSEDGEREGDGDAASELTGDVDFMSSDDEAGSRRERQGAELNLSVTEDAAHSRHASRLSAALTLRSVGGVRGPASESHSRPDSRQDDTKVFGRVQPKNGESEDDHPSPAGAGSDQRGIDEDEGDMGEWTGSEDMSYGSEDDEADDQSIGDFSNPSDEEKARQHRAHKRSRQHRMSLQIDDIPRKLPNFPRPPDNTMADSHSHAHHHSQHDVHHGHHASTFRRPAHQLVPVQQQYPEEEDIISNPSDEHHVRNNDRVYLGVVEDDYYVPSRSVLPPDSHSRVHSAQLSSHDPARAHSRLPSREEDRFVYAGTLPRGQVFHPPQSELASSRKDALLLNPNAKPFVLGVPSPFSPSLTAFPNPTVIPEPVLTPAEPARTLETPVPTVVLQAPGVPPKAPIMGHSRLPSVGKPLNVSAPEFTPTGFTFRPPPGGPQMSMPQAVTFPLPAYGESPYEPSADERAPVAIEADEPQFGGLLAYEGGEVMKPESPFRVQGREKRQRLGSGDDADGLAAFRFPSNLDSPASLLKTTAGVDAMASAKSPTPVGRMVEHVRNKTPVEQSATAFGFTGFADRDDEDEDEQALQRKTPRRRRAGKEDDEEAENRSRLQEFTFPLSASKPHKRAPLPLDFKTNNTVRAGVFKALAANSGPPSAGLVSNMGEDEALPMTSTRSRLSSHDVFEHLSRPSMDDNYVPSISRKVSKPVLGGAGLESAGLDEPDDVFGAGLSHRHRHSGSRHRYDRHGRRRSSLPDSLHDSISDLEREGMRLGIDLERLDGLLEEKMAGLKEYLKEEVVSHQQQQQHYGSMTGDAVEGVVNSMGSLSSTTEAMITEVVTLFRAQLEQSAARGLEEMDVARGEMDFQLIKDIIEQGHQDSLTFLRKELDDVIDRLWQLRTEELNAADKHAQQQKDWTPVIEQVGEKTVKAVVESISDLQARLESVNRASALRDRDSLVEKLVATLTATKAEPLDYEFLTNRLAQAVKPHISQLIDLTADKRETAGLIVEKLMPMLPSLGSANARSGVDTEALTSHLTKEIRKAIGPIDAFEIKEGVADLVVERLDSRLAVRDRAFNVESVTRQVVEAVGKMMAALEAVVLENVNKVVKEQQKLEDVQSGLGVKQDKVREDVEKEVVDAVREVLNELKETKSLVVQQGEKLGAPVPPAPHSVLEPIAVKDENVLLVKNTVDALAESHKTLENDGKALLAAYKDIVEKLNALPGSLATATTVLQDSHADYFSLREKERSEWEELRRMNNELQVQLAKARGAHGQIRVEKDVLGERLAAADSEREKLRAQVKELQAGADGMVEQVRGLERRNVELEYSLRLEVDKAQMADVTTRVNEVKMKDLEQANKELDAEKQGLKTKVNGLELEVAYANREKDATAAGLSVVQKQHDQLLSEQSRWDEFRQAAEKIEMLTGLIGPVDNQELDDLRQYRDRTKTLEAEHAALQKRFKDQEVKITNNERVAFTARQSLSQAQQRSSEWERRAKEHEDRLDAVQADLERSERAQQELDTDYSVVKLQLEEREADDRLTKDRETKLREQVADLEGQVARLHAEVEHARMAPVRPPTSHSIKTPTAVMPPATSYRGGLTAPSTNGYSTRPESRASTAHGERASSRLTHYSSNGTSTPPSQKPSVWDSMHAPYTPTAYQGLASSYSASSTRSPRYPALGPTSTPRTRRPAQPSYLQRSLAPPSPTPSTVSLTPTQGEDGWWS